jgi:hypothetical protein
MAPPFAAGVDRASTVSAAITYSVIVPLFDCRDAGMGALESALGQTFQRAHYEVIVVIDARANRAELAPLLARCDSVVAVDADFAAVESEIALFDAGARAARGEFLFFIEGHTVLAARALQQIDDTLARDPACSLACGRRLNHANTRLGTLIGGNNDAHELRARRQGNFTLGANCVIRRSLFDALGGFTAAFQRFNETVLYQRALDRGVRIGTIDAVLCMHHNDAGFAWLVRLLVATGHAKARYYATLHSTGSKRRARHPVYRWLQSTTAAVIAAVPLRIAGPGAILLAMALVRRLPRAAASVFKAGIGLTDVSGFCAERAWGASARHRAAEARSAPLQHVDAAPASAAIELERTA